MKSSMDDALISVIGFAPKNGRRCCTAKLR
jgi:hypothetical protein